jgi:predicted MFS family arabinose efflux permease
MREDLLWSYTLAGGMNTANALGYLLGALASPVLMRRWSPSILLMWGAVGASVFMALSGFFVSVWPLMAQRLLAGVASALVFIAGGLLAARLGARQPHRSGFLLGLYYGGTGLGIVLSALGVPWVLERAAGQPHAWTWAWWGLALLCALATALLAWPARMLAASEAGASPAPVAAPGEVGHAARALAGRVFRPRDFAFALAGYAGFGVGYIGYMTFVIALLREQGASAAEVTTFYALLGLAVVASSRIWAGWLDRYRNGQALARLNALLGVAVIVPALTTAWPLLLASGLLFGAVFLSVVASTTALVRHNLPPAQWAAGLSAFTIVFAAGQIVGPTVVGFIADGPGGLARGLVFSAGALWVGALLALRQRAL